MNSRVTIILTCFNRCTLTVNCIRMLCESASDYTLDFVVVDDKSSDGTKEQIFSLIEKGLRIHYLEGTGNSYWAGGMYVAIDYALKKCHSDYYLFVNDDVLFHTNVIDGMIQSFMNKKECSVIVGATCDRHQKLTYGGVRYLGKGVKYECLGPEYADCCDTFNMNCVMVDAETFFSMGNFDPVYCHSLADFDYGLRISRSGKKIYMFENYVGVCEKNEIRNTWQDKSLSRIERVRKKEDVKGAPFIPWVHFLRKNFGIVRACIYSITPYIRIIMGK